MNDAEIEAAILRKHQARISEEADAAIPDTSLEEADLELDDSQTVYELQADHQQVLILFSDLSSHRTVKHRVGFLKADRPILQSN